MECLIVETFDNVVMETASQEQQEYVVEEDDDEAYDITTRPPMTVRTKNNEF